MKYFLCNLLILIVLFSAAAASDGHAFSVRYPFESPKPSGNYRITSEKTLLMDGKTAGITIPNDSLQNPEKGISILAVVKTSSLPGNTDDDKAYDEIVYRHGQFTFGYNRKRIYVNFHNGKKWCAPLHVKINHSDGAFHAVCMTAQRIQEISQGLDYLEVKIYFDGTLLVSERFHNVTVTDNKNALNIGHADGFGDVWHWGGEIAEIKGINRVLNHNEIENFTREFPIIRETDNGLSLRKDDQALIQALPVHTDLLAAAASAIQNLARRTDRFNWKAAARHLLAKKTLPDGLVQYQCGGMILTVASAKDFAAPVSLYDCGNRRELLRPKNPFFRLITGDKIHSPADGEIRSWFEPLPDTAEGMKRFRIISAFPKIKAESEFQIDGKKLNFFMRVAPGSHFDKVEYPALELTTLDPGATLFTPEMSGVIYPNAVRTSTCYEADYPRGVASMQYGLFYDRRSGLFWASADPDARGKLLNFSVGGRGLSVTYTWVPPRNGGFTPCKNGIRLELFHGDWYDGAMIYRKLLKEIKAPWFSMASLPRHDTPAWARENLFWLRTHYSTSPEQYRRVAEYMKIPFAAHMSGWFAGNWDRDYPHAHALPGFTSHMEKLRALGIQCVVYVNGRLWELLDRREEDWQFTRIAKADCITDKNGELVINNFNNRDFAILCPYTELFENSIRKFCLEVPSWGAAGLYIDQIGAACHLPCYNSKHGHSVPDDTAWFSKGHNRVFPKIRNQMRAQHPYAVWTTEDNAETCVSNFDLLLIYRWFYSNQVPAFSAVYSGRVQLYGLEYQYANRDAALAKAAWQFSVGAQLGWCTLDSFVRPEFHHYRVWTKQLTRLRYALLDFFNSGMMMRPVQFTDPVPEHSLRWGNYGTKIVKSPVIRTSAWRWNGAEVITLLNPTDREQSNHVRLAQNFSTGKWYRFESSGKEECFDSEKKKDVLATIPPRSFQILLRVPETADGQLLLSRVRACFQSIASFVDEPDPFLTEGRKHLAIVDKTSGTIAIDTGIYECRIFSGCMFPDSFRVPDGQKRMSPLRYFTDPFGLDEIRVGKKRFLLNRERWAERRIVENTKEKCVIECRGTFCENSREEPAVPGVSARYVWQFFRNKPEIKVSAEIVYPPEIKDASLLLLPLRSGTRFQKKSFDMKEKKGLVIANAEFVFTKNQTTSHPKFIRIGSNSKTAEQKKTKVPEPAVHAAEQMTRLNLPASITLGNDKVELKLDSLKFWNINRIDIKENGKKRNFGIENPGSHYGMVFREQGSPFFVGTGHCESGKSEQVKSLRIFADGKEVMPGKETIHGRQICVVKVSDVGPFSVRYSFELNGNLLNEECAITSKEAVKCHCIYFFMHPWSTRFKELHALRPDGNLTSLKFKSDNGHPAGMNTFYQSIAMYDPDSGDALLTKSEFVEGASDAPKRYIWDRRVYRKDYTVDYLKKVFPAGHKAVYRSSTVFFPSHGKPVVPKIDK